MIHSLGSFELTTFFRCAAWLEVAEIRENPFAADRRRRTRDQQLAISKWQLAKPAECGQSA
jgi:hypothetical protein